MQFVDILRSFLSFCIILLIAIYGANGARYVGKSAAAAGKYIDKSQNAQCEGCMELGHPRAHASDPDATGPRDSVERYSESTGQPKSGFLSKDDQNLVAHHALSHNMSQDAMKLLNKGKYTMNVTLANNEFPIALPKMKVFYNGKPSNKAHDIGHVVLVLKNYEGKRGNKDADVFIYTMYPMIGSYWLLDYDITV
nr:PREDICTED: uncharacterized protein LOC100880940 [Megachile rotundata]